MTDRVTLVNCGTCNASSRYPLPTYSAGGQDGVPQRQCEEECKEVKADLTLLGCDLCGSEIVGKNPRPGWYHDGEAITCGDCGAVNRVSCDAESDPYVSGYVCKHGVSDDKACDLCEIEDGAGVGEVRSP